jgi:hypothetical protein
MSGFSKEFIQAARNMTGKALQDRIANSGASYLREGEHDCRVAGVDRNKLSENKISVKWEDANGRSHNDMLFVMEQDKKTGVWQWNWRFALLLASILPTTEAMDAFLSECVAGNAEVFDLLIGLRARVALERGKGYVTEHVNEGGVEYYRSVDNKTKEVLFQAKSLDELCKTTEAEGFKKAYVNVTKYTCTHGEENVESFGNSLAALHQPKVAAFPFKTKLA